MAHPQVRLVSFTGGVAGGRAIAHWRGCLKPTIMELGGKSPQLVLDDADIELAAAALFQEFFRLLAKVVSREAVLWFMKIGMMNSLRELSG